MDNQNQVFKEELPVKPGNREPGWEDEINLMDYFRVIYKRKMSIGVIFLIVTAAAVVVALIMPKTFESNALVKIGRFKSQTIEDIGDVKVIFSNDIVLKEIASRLDLPPETDSEAVRGMFDIEPEKESGFVKIKGRGETPEKAVAAVNVVTEMLINRHQQLFNEAEKVFNMEIELLKRDQQKTEKDIEGKEEEIKRLEQDIKYYEGEIKSRSNIQSEGQGRIVESYINLLAGSKNQKEAQLREVASLKQRLVNFDAAFQQKEYEKTHETKMTKVEVPPMLPQIKIAPNRRQIVMIAGVSGLFIGMLYAFAVEYIGQNRYVNKAVE